MQAHELYLSYFGKDVGWEDGVVLMRLEIQRCLRIGGENPEKIICVMGCMAQKDQKVNFNRVPFVERSAAVGEC